MSHRVILHSRYGRGLVIGTRHNEFELRVQFSEGEPRWVRLDQVSEVTPPEASPVPTESLPTRILSETPKARRMLEAFRMGIVPFDCVADFTFGRETEVKTLNKWLDRSSADQNAMLIVGNYGTGKTHRLNHLYNLALEQGFAAAHVEMDLNEVPFHRPKRVYNRLLRTLKFKSLADQKIGGFRELVVQCLGRGSLRDHPFLRFFLTEHKEQNWEWIEGSEKQNRPLRGEGRFEYDSRMPSLYDTTTAANLYCNILSALGWAASEALGLKGLCLIFDESEIIGFRHYYTYQIDNGFNFLRALIRTANNDPRLARFPESSGLTFARNNPVPFIHKTPTHLKTVFAFTPSPFLDAVDDLASIPRVDLEPLSDRALQELTQQIRRLYMEAYEYALPLALYDQVTDYLQSMRSYTRQFVKACVEALDLGRLNPNVLENLNPNESD